MFANRSAEARENPEIARVKKVIGQLEGVDKMIAAGRAAPDVIQQVKAAASALTALRLEILKRHLEECVTDAVNTGDYKRLVHRMLEAVQRQLAK